MRRIRLLRSRKDSFDPDLKEFLLLGVFLPRRRGSPGLDSQAKDRILSILMIIVQEKFGLLMKWLDPNEEAAGTKYENIRRRLICIFHGRGCFDAEDLADRTFDRVMQKLPQLADGYVGEPALYFYGVANKVHLEWLRRQKKTAAIPPVLPAAQSEQENEQEFDCLDSCLRSLSFDQRDLIIEYYRDEKRAKIEHRKSIADKLEISLNALQIKTSRIRSRLHSCVSKCVSESTSERF